MNILQSKLTQSRQNYAIARHYVAMANKGKFDKRLAHLAFNRARGRLQSVIRATCIIIYGRGQAVVK